MSTMRLKATQQKQQPSQNEIVSPNDVVLGAESRSKKHQPRQGGVGKTIDSPPDLKNAAGSTGGANLSQATKDSRLLNFSSKSGGGDEGIHRQESQKLLDETVFAAHHYDHRIGCKTFFFGLVIFAFSVGTSACLILYFEEHFWLIPAFFLFNVLVSWILLKELVFKSFLFSYGQSFITNREVQNLNERYCEQYTEVLIKAKKVISEFMIQEDFTPVQHGVWKDGSQALIRLIDWLERFVVANEELIRDHEQKLKLGKKTRRVVPDQLFRDATRIMGQMKATFKSVKIEPISAGKLYTVTEYYSELTNWDRQMHDSRRISDQPGVLYERVLPICASPEDTVALHSIEPLVDELIQVLARAPARLNWPRCLQCCCWRYKKRTSCCGSYTVLFGQIKQLGIILQSQFNAEHHWVKTEDGCKLDCMYFRQGRQDQLSSSQTSTTSSVANERAHQLDLIRPTFILCNSNAMFYQQMVHVSHTFYIKMFLEKGINVFTWNYRAYGRSKGTPTPENLKKDVVEVYNYMRNVMKLRGKIGIYGRSLGGIPSSYLSNMVDMAIIDRSFCNLAAMARWKYHSKFADYLFKIGSCGWQAQNDYFYLRSQQEVKKQSKEDDIEKSMAASSSSGCYKLITQDKHDEIIEVQASLMVGVAKEICLQQQRARQGSWKGQLGILSTAEIVTLVSNMHGLIEIEESLFFLIRKSESVEFTRPRASKQKNQGKMQQSQRQKSYLVVKDTDQNLPTGSGTTTTTETAKPGKMKLGAVELKAMKNLMSPMYARQVTQSQLNFDNGVPLFFMTMQIEISQLLDKMYGIGAGILTLHDIINQNKKTHIEEVRTFFQVMEVYGQNTEITGRPEVGDQNRLRNGGPPVQQDNLKVLRMKSLDQLTQVTESLRKTIRLFAQLAANSPPTAELPEPSHLPRMVTGVNQRLQLILGCLDHVRQYFLAKMKKIVPKEGVNAQNSVEPLFADMTTPKQEQVGFLIPLTCGHNRHPGSAEQLFFTKHLDIAGFLKPVEFDRNEEVVSCFSSPKKPEAGQIMQISKSEQEQKQKQKQKLKLQNMRKSYQKRLHPDTPLPNQVRSPSHSDHGSDEDVKDQPSGPKNDLKLSLQIVEENVVDNGRDSSAKLNQPDQQSDSENMVEDDQPADVKSPGLNKRKSQEQSQGEVSLDEIEFELAEVNETAQITPAKRQGEAIVADLPKKSPMRSGKGAKRFE